MPMPQRQPAHAHSSFVCLVNVLIYRWCVWQAGNLIFLCFITTLHAEAPLVTYCTAPESNGINRTVNRDFK